MSDNNDSNKPPYPVGYGRPPKGTRYKRGQSGNPSGRPKQVKGFAELTHDTLNKKLAVTLDGKRQRVTLRELLVDQAAKAALKGDRHARKLVLDADALRHAQIGATAVSSAHEQALDDDALNAYLERLAAAPPDEDR